MQEGLLQNFQKLQFDKTHFFFRISCKINSTLDVGSYSVVLKTTYLSVTKSEAFYTFKVIRTYFIYLKL